MAIDADSSYRYVGSGPALALEVHGPTMESCLARAVEGIAAAYGDVHPSIVGKRVEVVVHHASPAAMLRDVLDAARSLRGAGRVPVGVDRAELHDDRGLVVSFEVVPADGAGVVIDVRAVPDWEHVALERIDGHWVGRLVASD